MAKHQNFKREELTVALGEAQFGALIYFIPFIIIFGIPYYLLWGSMILNQINTNLIANFGMWSLLIGFSVFAAGIVAHELIHGLTWATYANKGIKSMKYGVIWKFMTPYCHCKEPLLMKHYITGTLMPGIILGFIPSILAIVTGSFVLFLFGLFFTLAAGGDFMMINILRKESMNIFIQDHPSKIGCYIYRPKQVLNSSKFD